MAQGIYDVRSEEELDPIASHSEDDRCDSVAMRLTGWDRTIEERGTPFSSHLSYYWIVPSYRETSMLLAHRKPLFAAGFEVLLRD